MLMFILHNNLRN